MPFYDLKCPKCCTEYLDYKCSILQISEGIECESCKLKLNLQVKLVVQHHSPIWFQLKGKGWTGRGK